MVKITLLDLRQPGIPDDERLIGVNEAALRLGISRELVRQWIRAGKLEGVKLSARRTRVRLGDVNRLIRQHSTSS